MNTQSNPAIAPALQQFYLLRELCDRLESLQAAIVGFDLAGIEHQSAQQLAICAELRALQPPAPESESERGAPRILAAASPAGVTPLGGSIARLAARAHYNGRVCSSLLRRAQRTNGIFLRLLAGAAATYTPAQNLFSAASRKA